MRELVKGKLFQGCLAEVKDAVADQRWKEHGISAIISVLFEERPRCSTLFSTLYIPVREDISTPHAMFDAACAFHKAFQPLFIHCVAGANRSRVFSAALLVGVHGMSIDEALKIADPPPGKVFDSFKEWASGIQRKVS